MAPSFGAVKLDSPPRNDPIGVLVALTNDPEPDVPKDVTPMAQCAFESLVFNVSAVYTN